MATTFANPPMPSAGVSSHASASRQAAATVTKTHGDNVALTILMPCLNEVGTLPTCIARARSFFDRTGIGGEILVADNGSVDGSQRLALVCGARVIQVRERGYGAALKAGIAAAKGRFVIMGDSDDSYDFSQLDAFVDALHAGHDLVVGNRFAGGIAPQAMPLLHRYLGNPVLSFIGRRFFGGPVRDFHCGLRGFRRDAMLQLALVTSGMEFASEMIIKSVQAGMRVAEVPTKLSKDGRNRAPHLNTWRDGWRHLRFLLLYTPRWLFLYPGALLCMAGLSQLLLSQLVAQRQTHWPVGIHTQLMAAAGLMLGYQTVLFALGAVLARHCARLDTPNPRERWGLRLAQSPWLGLFGGAAAVAGLMSCAALTVRWGTSGFGALVPDVAMRQIIPAVTLLLMGSQSVLAAVFFSAMRSAFESSRSVLPDSDRLQGWQEINA